MISVIPWTESTVPLTEIATEWDQTCNKGWLGIEVDLVSHLNDLHTLVESDAGDLLVLLDNGTPIGYMGVTVFKSPLSEQKIANEHYWFVQARRRGRGGLKLIRAAEDWARAHGCSHLILNASNLASGLHDKVCHLYEAMGMEKFETSYIRRV